MITSQWKYQKSLPSKLFSSLSVSVSAFVKQNKHRDGNDTSLLVSQLQKKQPIKIFDTNEWGERQISGNGPQKIVVVVWWSKLNFLNEVCRSTWQDDVLEVLLYYLKKWTRTNQATVDSSHEQDFKRCVFGLDGEVATRKEVSSDGPLENLPSGKLLNFVQSLSRPSLYLFPCLLVDVYIVGAVVWLHVCRTTQIISFRFSYFCILIIHADLIIIIWLVLVSN